MVYIISNSHTKLVVNSKGAQMMSIVCNGKERLWQNDNGSWPKHAPILFPHAGNCTIVVDGVHYRDQFHGFGRDLEFDLVDKSDDSITMVLKSNDFTKETYPYDFELYITYTLSLNGVFIIQRVVNPTDNDIYFFMGAHESYALDSEVKDYYIEFEKEEVFDSVVRPADTINHIGEGKILDLDTPLLDNAQTIILHNINSRRVMLKRKTDNKLLADTTFKDFTNLLLWHSLGSQMLCIEPWINMPDAEEDKEKEFKDKEHVIKVLPKSEKTLIRTINYY